MYSETKSRGHSLYTISIYTKYHSEIRKGLLPLPSPGKLLILVPALLYGCSAYVLPESHSAEDTATKTIIQMAGFRSKEDGSTLDILTFEDDRLRRLDSYYRIDEFSGDSASSCSTGGDKLLFLCADGQRDRYSWSDISSYSSLGGIFCEIEHERKDRHVMTGECRMQAGIGKVRVDMKPLVSEIVLKSIGCDFSGTPYAGSTITDVKAYLINVSASCPLLPQEEYRPSRIINTGVLNPADVKRFSQPEIIVQEIADVIGSDTIYPQAVFLCYPNNCTQEGPGTPHTKLVIEGKVGPETYYWPVSINRERGNGIERNRRYVYDLFIRRKGVTEPDTPFTPLGIEFNFSIEPWKEKEDYAVTF